MIDDGVPQSLREAIDRELARGEVLVWLEQPVPGLLRWAFAWSMFVIGVVGVVYSIPAVLAGARGEWQPTDKPVPAIFGVVVAVGHLLGALGFMMVPLHVWRDVRDTAYAITNRRVLVMRRGLLGRIDRESIPATSLEPSVKPYRDDRRGDILLVAKGSYDKTRGNMFRLVALSDVRATEAALRRLIQSSSKSSL